MSHHEADLEVISGQVNIIALQKMSFFDSTIQWYFTGIKLRNNQFALKDKPFK